MIALNWDNPEHTVVLWRFSGDWTRQELIEALKEHRELVTPEKGPICTLFDLTESGSIPSGLATNIPRFAAYLPDKEHRSVATAIVGNRSNLIPTLLSIFSRLYGSDFVYFETVDEARAEIARRLADAQKKAING